MKGLSKERYVQVYEMLALVCALMLSICVSFYTSAAEMDHVYGVICCIAGGNVPTPGCCCQGVP